MIGVVVVYIFALNENVFKNLALANTIDEIPTNLVSESPLDFGAYTDTEYYKTIEEALKTCNNCTITLNKDVDDLVITEGKNITIDANGYKIANIENHGKINLYDSSNKKGVIRTVQSLLKNSENKSDTIDSCSITNYGEMKIEDFKLTASHNVNNYVSLFGIRSKLIGIRNKGTIEINNCNIVISTEIKNLPSYTKNVTADLYGLDNTGDATISGTSITVSADTKLLSSVSYSEKMLGILNSEKGIVKSINSKILISKSIGYSKCSASAGDHAGVNNKDLGIMSIDGCSISVKTSGCKNKLYTSDVGVYNSSSNDLTINGGEILVQSSGTSEQGSEEMGIYCVSSGKVYIGKDEKTCHISIITDYGASYALYVRADNANLNIGNVEILSTRTKKSGYAYGIYVNGKDGIINLGKDDNVVYTLPLIHSDDTTVMFTEKNNLNMYDGILTTYSEYKKTIAGEYTTNKPEGYELKQSEKENGLCCLYLNNEGSITYELYNGNFIGNNVPTSYTYGVGTMLPLAEKKGYVFDGWYENTEFSGEKIVSVDCNRVGDITLYSKWIPNSIELETNEMILNYNEKDINNFIDLDANILNLSSVLGVKEYVLSDMPSEISYSESKHSLVCCIEKAGTYIINVEVIAKNGACATYKIIINKATLTQPMVSKNPTNSNAPNVTTKPIPTVVPALTGKKSSIATNFNTISAKKSSLTLRWKKKSVTGYEIHYSTNSKFKGAKKIMIKSNSTTTRKINDLVQNKKYYLRIRTYTKITENKKTITVYSNWSKTKTKKTKK